MPRTWLLKSEPDCYSIDDLHKDTHAVWSGIRNFQARNFLRDDVKKSDLCLFYHSGAKPAAVGLCRVIREGHPDLTQFDPKDEHADPTSDPKNPRWFAVDVEFVEKFARPVALPEMKKNPRLAKMRLLARGNRLSVFPIEPAELEEVRRMGRDGES